MSLPTNRTISTSPSEHVADHNEVHSFVNQHSTDPAAHPGVFEPAGTVATHAAASDPHPTYLTAAEGAAAYEASGAAASAVSTHAALADPHTGYVLESLIDAAGDLYVGTANNTVGRLAIGAALTMLRVNAGATALEWVVPPDNSLITANLQTASYTLVLTDAGKVVEMNVAGANTLTVPGNGAVAFPIGTTLQVHQYGAGQVTLTPAGGVNIRSNGGKLKTAAQYATVYLRKRATNEWVAWGDLVV